MIRKVVYIVCFLLCFSCNNAVKKSENATAKEAVEVTADTDGLMDDKNRKDLDSESIVSVLTSINVNTEIEEKLQANYEAALLATKHPEFREAIKEQLADSNKFNFSFSDSIQSIEIKDLVYIGSIASRNDSISTQKIVYSKLINSKYIQKDSVLVIVKRKLIEIDNAARVNTSFLFEKLKD